MSPTCHMQIGKRRLTAVIIGGEQAKVKNANGQMPTDRDIQVFPGLGGRLAALLRQQQRGGDGTRITQLELANQAGISRQTLSDAMNADRASNRTIRQLAKVLEVPEDALRDPQYRDQWEPPAEVREDATSPAGVELEEFLSNFDRIVRTLRNMPGGELGMKLKIGFLNAVEDVARETGNKLPLEYYQLRKRVSDGEL